MAHATVSHFTDAPDDVILNELKFTGLGLTVTRAVFVAVHPFAEVPVTVYVVLAIGVAITGLPVV